MDLCTFTFLRWSQACFPIARGSSFCQSLLLSPFIIWFGTLLGEDGVRNIIEYLSSPYPWKPRLLFLAEEGPRFPQPFSYHQCTYRSFSCCPWPLGFFFNESFHTAVRVWRFVAARGASCEWMFCLAVWNMIDKGEFATSGHVSRFKIS